MRPPRYYGLVKRTIDVGIAAAGLVVLAPLALVSAALIRWRLGSPVLFRQSRPGLNAAPFVLLKFRTMRDARGSDGELLPDEERMTGLGRFLRSTSLDEYPQLWNVLAGSMSLVGPRPLLMEYLPLYSPEQARRHAVVPGITGWAQVGGRNGLSWDQRLRRDVWYVDNRSLGLDLRILGLTVGAVLRRKGVRQPGRATVDRFRGTDAQ